MMNDTEFDPGPTDESKEVKRQFGRLIAIFAIGALAAMLIILCVVLFYVMRGG